MKTYIDTILNEESLKERSKNLVHFKGSYKSKLPIDESASKVFNGTVNEAIKINDVVEFKKSVSAEIEIEEEGEGDEPIYKTNVEEIRAGARGRVTYVDEANDTVDIEFKNSVAQGVAQRNLRVVE